LRVLNNDGNSVAGVTAVGGVLLGGGGVGVAVDLLNLAGVPAVDPRDVGDVARNGLRAVRGSTRTFHPSLENVVQARPGTTLYRGTSQPPSDIISNRGLQSPFLDADYDLDAHLNHGAPAQTHNGFVSATNDFVSARSFAHEAAQFEVGRWVGQADAHIYEVVDRYGRSIDVSATMRARGIDDYEYWAEFEFAFPYGIPLEDIRRWRPQTGGRLVGDWVDNPFFRELDP